MGAKVHIKAMLKYRGMTYRDLAEMTGNARQTILNKMANDKLQYDFVERAADLLGFDIVFKDRETGKEV